MPLPRRNSLSPCHEHLEDKDLASFSFGTGWSCDRVDAHTPGDTFVGLCRLTCILSEVLDEFHSVRSLHGVHRDALATAQRIKSYFTMLEDWKDLMPPSLKSVLKDDGGIGRGTESIPGTRSLQLSYLGVNLLLCRTALDSVTKNATQDLSRLMPAHRAALHSAIMVVEYLESLSSEDFNGFFLHYGSHHLASCLSLMARLCFGFARMENEPMLSTSIGSIQRLLVVLSKAHRLHKWDLAELALTRSRAVLPALEARIPSFPRLFSVDPAAHSTFGEESLVEIDAKAKSARRGHTSRKSYSLQQEQKEQSGWLSGQLAGQGIFGGHIHADDSGQVSGFHSHSQSSSFGQELPPRDTGHTYIPSQHGGMLINGQNVNDEAIFHLQPGPDGTTGQISIDAVGLPYPIGMVGGADMTGGPQSARGGGSYVVDGTTTGMSHLMSGMEVDWLGMGMHSFSYPTTFVNASNGTGQHRTTSSNSQLQ